MILCFRALIGTAALSLALTAGWFAAFLSWAEHRTSLKPAKPPALKAPASPWTEPDYYIASEIGVAYHDPRADCFYMKKQAKHTIIKYPTRAKADASGKHACTNCLNGKATRSEPLAQAPGASTQSQ